MNPFERIKSTTQNGEHKGVVSALVVDNVDPESFGRIKVQFNWLQKGEQSFWARVATPMAGNEQGIYFLPEIDDEVLVVFEHGKIEYPVVIGSLWSGLNLPPQNNDDGENNIRQIRSRSGHTLSFDDSEGAEKMTLESSALHKIKFDDSAKTISIESEGGNKIVIDDSSQEILIEDSGGNHIKMEANSNSNSNRITVKSSGDLILEGMNVTIKAGASLKLEGSAGVELTSSAITTVKGSLVEIN